MKVGTEFKKSLVEMMEPHLGRLVEVPVEGEKGTVLARIMSVDEDGVTLKAVPHTTRA